MFSPSLIAMIWHSLREAVPGEVLQFENQGDIARYLRGVWSRFVELSLSRPQVPIVGRGAQIGRDLFGPHASVVENPRAPGFFVYGRVPVELLVKHFAENHWKPSAEEFLDLGTPLAESAPAGAASLATCQALLALTGTNPPVVKVAFIDRGVSVAGGVPNNFGGKLSHAITSGIELSAHATDVLAVLLDRLDSHAMLGDVAMHCALVAPPASAIGLACFQHVSSVELLNAVTALDTHLRGLPLPTIPVCVNLSLGTHVGPHDGNSPLEDFMRSHFAVASQRYMHVCAGNDGVKGISAIRSLNGKLDEFVSLRLGPTGSTEVLVELWWDTASSSGLSASVELSQAGSPITISPMRISAATAGTTFAASGVTSGPSCQALFHAACHGGRSCIAFSVSAPTKAALANVDVDITLSSPTPTTVNAWLVVCDDARSSFAESGTVASIRVPATEREFVGVAGVTANGQPWIHSSRGPAAWYGSFVIPFADSPPYVAHLVSHPSSSMAGTSLASPRACADSAALLRSAGTVPTSASDLAKRIVLANGAILGPWNPRVGYGAIT